MIKSELISRLQATQPHLFHRDAEAMTNCLFGIITEGLCEGARVELRGFGTLTLREREARMGRNPRTGEAVSVCAKYVPFFKAGKELRMRVDKAGFERDAAAAAENGEMRRAAE